MCMQRDDLYLRDIIEALDHIDAFIGEVDFQGFVRFDERSASLRVRRNIFMRRVEIAKRSKAALEILHRRFYRGKAKR